jgi:hypothetical protein
MPKGYALAEATKDAIWELRAQGLSDAAARGRGSVSRPRPTASNRFQWALVSTQRFLRPLK